MTVGWWAENITVIATSLRALRTNMPGVQTNFGEIALTLHRPVAGIAGVELPQGSIVTTLPRPVAEITGAQTQSGVIATLIHVTSTAIMAAEIEQGTIAAALSKVSTTTAGAQRQQGTIAAQLPKVVGAISGEEVTAEQFPYTLPFQLEAPTYTSTAPLTGSGALTVTAHVLVAAALSGSGALSVAAGHPAFLAGSGALTATASAVPQTLFNVVGAGTKAHPTAATTETWSWTHDIASTDNAVVAPFDLIALAGTGSFSSIAATCGGQTMTLLGTQIRSGSTISRLCLFGLLINQSGAPTLSGSQSIVVTTTWTSSDMSVYGVCNSSSYSDVTSFDTVAKSTGSNAPGATVSLSVPAPATNSRIAQVFSLAATATGSPASSIGSYNQTTEWSSASVTGTYDAYVLGDAPGGTTVTFSFVIGGGSASYPWIAMAVPLNP